MNTHSETEWRTGAVQRKLDKANLVAERDRLLHERDTAPNDKLRDLRNSQLRDVNLRLAAM